MNGKFNSTHSQIARVTEVGPLGRKRKIILGKWVILFTLLLSFYDSEAMANSLIRVDGALASKHDFVTEAIELEGKVVSTRQLRENEKSSRVLLSRNTLETKAGEIIDTNDIKRLHIRAVGPGSYLSIGRFPPNDDGGEIR